MSDLHVDGMGVSAGVVETIVAIATQEVDGVASVGSAKISGLRGRISNKVSGNSGIDVHIGENDHLAIAVHIVALYGAVLPELAESVRAAISDAVTTQVGAHIDSIDVYVEGLKRDR